MSENFCFGDECTIVDLGEGAFHFETRKCFAGKRVKFVSYGKSELCGGNFIACTLHLLEDICTNKETGERMLSGHAFYFPCVKLVKATP